MMNSSFNKKFAEMFGKIDEKVLEAKLNKAFEMLKSSDPEELAKSINKVDKNELLSKINEFDESKLQGMNIDKEEIRKKVNDADLKKLSNLIGDQGDEIIKKLKDILNK